MVCEGNLHLRTVALQLPASFRLFSHECRQSHHRLFSNAWLQFVSFRTVALSVLHICTNFDAFLGVMAVFHDEVEIEDFTYDEESELYHYPCPCGDRFEITK